MIQILMALALGPLVGGIDPDRCVATASGRTCRDEQGNSFGVSDADYDWQPIVHWPDGTVTFVHRSMIRQVDGGSLLVRLKTEADPSRGALVWKARYDCVGRTSRFMASSSFSAAGRLVQTRNVDEAEQYDRPVASDPRESRIFDALCAGR